MKFRPNREENDAVIRILAEKYPACFFEEPALRRPLKKNILADLERDGTPVSPELLPHAIAWYESRFAYQYTLKAGAKRIDLNGEEVQVVTEAEQCRAEKYIAERRQQQYERNGGSPVQTMTELHRKRQVSDDAFRKIDAPKIPPPVPKQPPAMTAPKQSPVATMPAQIASVQSALDAVRQIMVEAYSPAIRVALAVAGLGVVIAEAQKSISELQDSA